MNNNNINGVARENGKDSMLLEEVLRRSEGDASLVVDEVDVTPGCSTGDNYMSLVTRVVVRGTKGKRCQKYSRSLIMKRQPSSQAFRELFNCGAFFLNERATYYDVIPTLQRFSRHSRSPFPKCLHATEDVIVLEDLQPFGFKMPDRLKGLDFTHCKLVFKELAGFHAMSLAMKHQDVEKFNAVRNCIKETVYAPNNEPVISPSLRNAFQIALMTLKFIAREDKSLLAPIELLENTNKNIFHKMANIVKPKEPFAVICHGDCWINNFLFKYRQDDCEIPDEVRLIDLQVTRYASPAIDILHFLYTSTQKEIRRDHFDDLLLIYHDALMDVMRKLVDPIKAESIFTLEQLKNEMRVNALYGLINGLWLLPAVTADAKTLPPLDELEVDEIYSQGMVEHWITHQTQDYKDRVCHLVREYIERGFL